MSSITYHRVNEFVMKSFNQIFQENEEDRVADQIFQKSK